MTKKTLTAAFCVFLAAVTLLGCAIPCSAVITMAETAVVGDVNCDGSVNAMDSYTLKLSVAGLVPVESVGASDANGDGSVDAQDSYLLRTFLAGLRASLVADNGHSVKRITVAKNSIEEYEIVVPSDEALTNDNLMYAADELQKYINTAYGCSLPIVSERSGAPAFVYALDSLDSSGELGVEGIDIRVENGDVFITGGTKRGCLYATYEFLERYIGCVFINDDTEYVHNNQVVHIENGANFRFVPKIADRGLKTMSTESATTAVKWKNSSTKCCVNILYSRFGGGIETGSVHTIGDYTYCPNDKFICYSNKTIRAEVVEGVIAKIESQLALGRKMERVVLGPMDNPGCCSCRFCNPLVKKEGSYMGAQLTFVNYVAGEIKELYPDTNILTTAYWYARRPPETLVPADNVEIMYCWAGCNNHPFDGTCCYEEGNALWYNNIKESQWFEKWTEIADRVWVWIYCGSYSWSFAQPTMLDCVRENLAYLAEHGVYGIYCEGEYGYPEAFGDGYSFDLLTMYMLGRCTWDPDMTEEEYDAYVDEFLAVYYGPGWEQIKRYLEINALATEEREACWCNNFNMPFDCLDMDCLRRHSEEMFSVIDTALELCETEAQRTNTERLASCIYWQALSVTYEDDYENGTEEQRALYTERYQRMHAWIMEHELVYRVTVPETDEVVDPYSWTGWEVYNHTRNAEDPMDYV